MRYNDCVQHLIGFNYDIGDEVIFYCSERVLRGTIVEQSNYLNKDCRTVTGYAIKSDRETYFHTPEENVFPKSMDTDTVMKIVKYRAILNEHGRLSERKEMLEEKLEELRAGIPDEMKPLYMHLDMSKSEDKTGIAFI